MTAKLYRMDFTEGRSFILWSHAVSRGKEGVGMAP